MKHWYKPEIKVHKINELVNHVKVAANSFAYPLPTERPTNPDAPMPGCVIEICWYSESCDILPVA